MSKPAYALLSNRATGFGPYEQTNGRLHTFCISGDIDKIDAFLDQMFKVPSGGSVDFEAATHKLFVSFAHFPSVRAANPIDVDRGVLFESDAALWALARRRGTLFDLRWIPLFLFVDDGCAMATGREVYGFPKQLGKFDLPDAAPPSDGPFRVEANVLHPFDHNSISHIAPIFEFEADPSVLGLAEVEELDLREGIISRLAPEFRGAETSALDMALTGNLFLFDLPVKMAFLKQFPDTEDPTKACFQSIVEAKARTTHVRGAGWTRTHYRGQVFSYDSHPFADALGIASGPIQVGRALWADFDFVMELGEEIWRASI